MALHTFDPAELSVVYGSHIVRGFSEEQVTVTRDNPAFEMVIGADGEATRVKSNDRSGSVTITLQQSSPSNDFLSSIALADELSNTGLLPLLIKDNLGTSLYSAVSAYIEQIPEAAYGKTNNDRVWTIRTDNLIAFVGSNITGNATG